MTVDRRIARLEKEPTWENVANAINGDAAGRNDDLVAFIELLDRIDGPYTLMLDAPWGEGKTFFVKSVLYIMNALDKKSSAVETDVHYDQRFGKVIDQLEEHGLPALLPLYFNAWENDDAEDPISALFAVLASQLDQEGLTRRPNLEEGLLKVVDAAVAAISPLNVCVSDFYNALKGDDLIAVYRKRLELREAIVSLASKANLENADKLVIFIDELDRCRPDFAVRLLEQIKALFQSESIITVISADSVQLSKAMAGIYGEGYDSQRFLERFFDYRVVLPPCDSFKVATGKSFQRTTYRFDELEKELFDSHLLTPRDMMRLLPKLDEARSYAAGYSEREDDIFDRGRSFAAMAANCAFLPILIFIQRENSELFRSITAGADFDSLYEEGRKYPSFIDTIKECIGSTRSRDTDGRIEASDDDIRKYVHDLCVVIFSSDAGGEAVDNARRRLGISGKNIPAKIYKTLSFPVAQQDGA